MANIKSAKKRARQSEIRRKKNLARKTELKTAIKKVLLALVQQKDVVETKNLLKNAESKLARAKNKGVIHRNAAARKISHLARKVAALEKR